jgi:enoyl-CoA hydratase/carnithine racemase
MPHFAQDFPADVPDQPELVDCARSEAGIVTLTIRRPEVMNCLSFPTLRRLRSLFHDLAQDLDVRAIVITGAGGKAFCAGADLKEQEHAAERVPFVKNIRRRTISRIASRRSAQSTAQFRRRDGTAARLRLAHRRSARAAGLTETSLAIIPGAGGTQRLPRLAAARKN